jgi:hypothetical protein
VSQQTTNRSFDDLARALAEGSLSRRRALKLFAGTALAALIPSRALAGDDDDDCVRVCHVPRTSTGDCDFANARTRCVSRRERRRHLENHHPCDCRGSCRNCLTPPECLPGGVECTNPFRFQCCSDLCDEGGTCHAFGTNLLGCICNDTSGGTQFGCLPEDCNTLPEADEQRICGPLCESAGGFSGLTTCQLDSPECVV